MALTLNLAMLPVMASLVAGTGALATYSTTSNTSRDTAAVQTVAAVGPEVASVSKAVPSPAAPAVRACDAQAWPYIDASCTRTSADDRKVRVVAAPRSSELPEGTARLHIPNPNAPAATPPGMVSSDTVLRSPDIVVPPRKLSKREKRAEQRRERRFETRSYAVPSEARDQQRLRPVVVVRPLRLEAFR